jgi:hypothetical protein
MIDFIRPNLNIPGPRNIVRLYWVATVLFTILYLSSIVLTLSDIDASYASYTSLGFPTWLVYFNSSAKILGLAAVLHNKSRTLKEFAFAGFLYDLLLALTAHIVNRQTDVLLAIMGLVLWVFAFAMYRIVYPVQDNLQIKNGG